MCQFLSTWKPFIAANHLFSSDQFSIVSGGYIPNYSPEHHSHLYGAIFHDYANPQIPPSATYLI